MIFHTAATCRGISEELPKLGGIRRYVSFFTSFFLSLALTRIVEADRLENKRNNSPANGHMCAVKPFGSIHG